MENVTQDIEMWILACSGSFVYMMLQVYYARSMGHAI